MRLLLALFFISAGMASGALRDQEITLEPGWNAVWLEVEPQKADGTPQSPAEVFQGVPEVAIVARYLPANARFEFIEDVSVDSLGNDFWLKWRRDTQVGGNTLGGMEGNTAYLIFNRSEAAVEMTLNGAVSFHRYDWQPNSFNFVGVSVGTLAPTFSEYFSPSGTHPLNQIYKLAAGKWVAVAAGERMRKNTAYWTYCGGSSSYQGPVPVLLPDLTEGVLDLGETVKFTNVTAGNLAPSASGLTLLRLVNDGIVVRDATGGSGIVDFDITTDGTGAGTLASRSSATVRLEIERGWTTAPPMRENLYLVQASIAGGSSYQQYLPLRARSDLAMVAAAGAPLPGLWVGDVVMTHATSLVAGKAGSGPRLESVRRPMRYRVILHGDAGGQTRLLEHATLMKKQQASDQLPDEFVVVVDDTKIPDFIGIEQRGGKLVGKRFDTAGYDLPRSVLPTVQDEANPNFAPATLSTEYLLSLPLNGALAPGGVITTQPNSLVLDAWHRTHPYRHVFNPEHAKGFRIIREMRFEMDAAGSPEADRTPGFGASALSGVFEESVYGLTKPGDVHRSRGRFVIQRVSEVSSLQ
ncbi:hypothetical protein FEM03_19550 [Phragmitibacter flavus]|uniref:IgGFc-binding protein N-terminal domain-containing protein n=1 Tax=Phragmitibacter flavus TaxID=2576071 RepID=A0A5R8K9V3_9BACT|nr:hypothetical protein [Phragmitibacter flavus]TLD69066.1 hypothetical protein FEM03_19550 [Phragmitibacter flavus]